MSSEYGQQPGDSLPLVDSALISRSPSMLTTEVGGEVLMMNVERGCYFTLNDVACDIWHRLDAPCSFARLIDGLVADYDATRATIVADVKAVLRQMVSEDIVRIA